jgi:DNA-binding MurR/RpiR family transcriptional regulator
MSDSVAALLRARFEALTRAERQLANALLEGYPVSGLASITGLAENAGVSPATVARLVQKLGFKGFPEFQATLRQELEASISNPIAKRDRWADAAPDTHILNRFADAAMKNLEQSLAQLDPKAFDAAVAALSDEKRHLFVVGGRITKALAHYLFIHMQVIRPNVTLVSPETNGWPQYVLNMRPGDVLVMFDVRRYERDLERLAEVAGRRRLRILLFTDQWQSPAAKHARHCFPMHIEAPSAWDSNMATLLVVEALIAAVQERTWKSSQARIAALEELFDKTRLFRKFV